jgi:uncharacterized membrane protein
MKTRTALIVSLAIAVLTSAVSIWGWVHIPDSAHIAVHWTASGKVNNWWPKDKVLAFGPIATLGLTALFAIIPAILPLRRNMLNNPAYTTAWTGTVLLFAALHAMIVARAGGLPLKGGGHGVLLAAAIGNYLGKARRNWAVGVRTPWSLSSDYAWDKSNRLAGRLLVITGLLTLAAVAFQGTRAGVIVLIAGVLSIAVIATTASYFYWRTDAEREG